MRRFPLIGTLLLIPGLVLLIAVGCSPPATNKDKDKKDGSVAATDGKDKDKGGKKAEITTATTATIKGTVKLKGKAPEPKVIDAIAKHTDKDFCLKGDVKDQQWMVNNDGAVENVVVWLAPPEGKSFKITDALKEPFMKKVVQIHQPFCQYIPHVAAVYADIQKFQVTNEADVTHNVKIVGDVKNGTTNDNLPKGTPTPERTYKKQNNPISVECSAHTWMNAKLWTFDQPYFAVTDKNGTFTIANVPIGEELAVWVWHEVPGKSEAKKHTFKEGENKLDLEISASK